MILTDEMSTKCAVSLWILEEKDWRTFCTKEFEKLNKILDTLNPIDKDWNIDLNIMFERNVLHFILFWIPKIWTKQI